MPLGNMLLRQRLMAIMLLTSGAVLLLTCAGFFAYEMLTFRQATSRQLSTIAAIIAENSTAVLAFDDPAGAREILSALKAEPHIVEAGLYDASGGLFSTYPVEMPATEFPTVPAADGYRFDRSFLTGFQPVSQGGKRLGTLYVKSDLKAVSTRFRLYGIVAVTVAAMAFLLAYLLSRVLQRQISAPILNLADTARAVSDRLDYSVRATRQGTGELALLTDAFNQMLTQIQEQLARMQLLNQITRAIGERLDLSSIFQVMVGALEDNLPVDLVCVCEYEATSKVLTVTTVGAKTGILAAELGVTPKARMPVEEMGIGPGYAQGKIVYQPDLTGDMSAFPLRLSGRGMRSMVVAPLVVESRVFGVLIAVRSAADGFSGLDREFLRQLSDHAALAAHQAHLYLALQQAYDDLRRSQQAVMQQERLRALGQLASGIAHDINNAISPAALYTEALLAQESNLSPRARDQLQTIGHAIEDVSATVARIREFSRQREPQMKLVPVQLNRSLQQVLDLTRARWNDTPQQRGVVIDIVTDLDPKLPVILGVEGEIREALTNLFLNAFDAMPEGGSLTLRTRVTKDKQVRLEVSDTGAGMDDATRRRCLEPFYTTKGERGTGLGLAMVYGVAERHGATVEIESAVGVGTTIRLLFPIPAAAVAETYKTPPPARLQPLRVLIVDDDPLVAKVLRDTLQIDGHDIVTANGGQSGIDAFLLSVREGKPFDVVMTDLGMPYVDGRKVAAAVKHASAITPVILLTGWGQSLLADGEMPPHVDRLLSKPPKMADLREALAACAPHAIS